MEQVYVSHLQTSEWSRGSISPLGGHIGIPLNIYVGYFRVWVLEISSTERHKTGDVLFRIFNGGVHNGQ